MKRKDFWNIVILVGILAIIITLSFATNEILNARGACHSLDGEYHLKLSPLPIEHLCNGKAIVKYQYGWDYNYDLAHLWENFSFIEISRIYGTSG